MAGALFNCQGVRLGCFLGGGVGEGHWWGGVHELLNKLQQFEDESKKKKKINFRTLCGSKTSSGKKKNQLQDIMWRYNFFFREEK